MSPEAVRDCDEISHLRTRMSNKLNTCVVHFLWELQVISHVFNFIFAFTIFLSTKTFFLGVFPDDACLTYKKGKHVLIKKKKKQFWGVWKIIKTLNILGLGFA